MGSRAHHEREHELFIEHVAPRLVDLAIATAPVWAYLLLDPLSREIDKTYWGVHERVLKLVKSGFSGLKLKL